MFHLASKTQDFCSNQIYAARFLRPSDFTTTAVKGEFPSAEPFGRQFLFRPAKVMCIVNYCVST